MGFKEWTSIKNWLDITILISTSGKGGKKEKMWSLHPARQNTCEKGTEFSQKNVCKQMEVGIYMSLHKLVNRWKKQESQWLPPVLKRLLVGEHIPDKKLGHEQFSDRSKPIVSNFLKCKYYCGINVVTLFWSVSPRVAQDGDVLSSALVGSVGIWADALWGGGRCPVLAPSPTSDTIKPVALSK